MHAPAPLHLEDTSVLDAVLATATLVLGLTGLLLVAFDQHDAGALCGAVGVATGLWGQMVSRTTSERFADVVGLVAAALALGIGLIA